MSRIYSKALKVIAWIGVENPNFARQPSSAKTQAFDRLHDLNNSRFKRPASPCISKSKLEAVIQGPDEQLKLNSLAEIQARTYWDRLWIIQELILARDIEIRCGTHVITWNSLHEAFLAIEIHRPEILLRRGIYGLIQDERLRREYFRLVDIRSLFEFFENFSQSECSDPRDKVYGLLSLVPPCCQEAVKVDYSRTAHEIGVLMMAHELKHLDRKGRWGHSRLENMISHLGEHHLLDPAAEEDLPISGFSFRTEQATAVKLWCSFLGAISSVRKHEKGDILSLDHGSVAWTSEVQSERGTITVHTTDPIEAKDLVYRINTRDFLILLRRSERRLLMIGWAQNLLFVDAQHLLPSTWQPDNIIRASYKDRIYLNMSALCSFVRICEGKVEFRCESVT